MPESSYNDAVKCN